MYGLDSRGWQEGGSLGYSFTGRKPCQKQRRPSPLPYDPGCLPSIIVSQSKGCRQIGGRRQSKRAMVTNASCHEFRRRKCPASPRIAVSRSDRTVGLEFVVPVVAGHAGNHNPFLVNLSDAWKQLHGELVRPLIGQVLCVQSRPVERCCLQIRCLLWTVSPLTASFLLLIYEISTGHTNTRSLTAILCSPAISNAPRRRISSDELPTIT